jgi:site-specific DNA-methyltransferase (adenine-specific)
VFERGRESYDLADKELLRALDGIPVLPVHRNKGIDALLRGNEVPGPVFFRVQRQDETLDQACSLLEKACKGKSPYAAVVIATNDQKSLFPSSNAGLHIIRCTKLAVKELLAGLGSRTVSTSNGRTCLITAER